MKELMKKIERELLIQIVLSVRHMRMTLNEAKKLSQEFKKSFSLETEEEIFEELFRLGKEYKEALKVYLKFVGSYEEEKTNRVLSKMREFMKIPDFDKAVNAAKGVNIYGSI